MSDRRGISGKAFSPLGGNFGSPLFLVSTTFGAATATYNALSNASKPLRVVSPWVVLTAAGGGTDTISVTNGTTAITDVSDISAKSDKDIVRFASLDDAQYRIEKDGKVVASSASANATGIVYALCCRL
jgi:hypothetical protein